MALLVIYLFYSWQTKLTIKIIITLIIKVQKFLEGVGYVTASWVPYVIYELRSGLKKCIESQVSDNVMVQSKVVEVCRVMMKKFEERWGSGAEGTACTLSKGNRNIRVGFPKAVLLAAAVDPRTKDRGFFSETDWKGIYELLIEKCFQLLKEHNKMLAESTPAPATDVSSAKKVVEIVEDGGEDDDDDDGGSIKDAYNPGVLSLDNFDIIFGSSADQNTVAQEQADGGDGKLKEQVKVAIAAWKELKPVNVSTDPLEWWRLNEATSFVVSLAAKAYLPVPATSADCERVGSTGRETCGDRRARLGSENVRDLVFLHDSHHKIEQLSKETN